MCELNRGEDGLSHARSWTYCLVNRTLSIASQFSISFAALFLIRESYFCGFFLGMGLFFLILCCSWQDGTCGSLLSISLAWDVWLSKRDYLTGLLLPASWHCWPAVALHTKEKRNGNTRGEIKFDAGCAAWAWLRVQWESCVRGRWFTEPNSWIYWKAKTWSVVTVETGTARLCFACTLFSHILEERRSLWCCFGLSWLEQNVLRKDYSWQIKCCICFLVQRWLGVPCRVAFLHACTTFPVDSAHLVFGKCTLALEKALQLFFLIIYPKELDE